MAERPNPSVPTANAAGTQVKREALPKLLNLLSPVAHSWDLFALQIGVPSTQISLIKVANPQTGPSYVIKCFTQALEWWEANHYNPVYEKMIDVLDPGPGKLTLVMNRALACELRKFMAEQQNAVFPMSAAGIPTASPDLQDFTQTNEFMIRGKFASLLEFIQVKFQQRLGTEKIKHELRLYIIRLYNLPESSIPVTSDVAVIFEAMRSHKMLTYLNVTGLEHAIKHFCEDDLEMQGKMEQYKKDRAGFELATKIKDYIPKARSKFPFGSDRPAFSLLPKQAPSYLTELTVNLKQHVAEYHLDYLRELWNLLSTVLSLPPLYVLLDAVIMNSILVMWLIPTTMVPEAIQRAKQNADAFRMHPIMEVTIGDECVYSRTEPTAQQVVMASPDQTLHALDRETESSEHELHNLLMQACREGQLDRLKKLLKQENAATLIVENGQDGLAPIHCAAYNNHKPIIELLLSEDNRRVDHPSQHRETALHIACMRRHTELARLLLQNGANPLAMTAHGNTPLHYAASTDCAELVEMLLHGILVKAHIDEVNTDGQTAAEIATTLGCVKAVNVLRDHGANFQLKNSLGYTAVDVAEMLGNTRCHGIASEPPPRQVLQHSQHHQLPKEALSAVLAVSSSHDTSSTPDKTATSGEKKYIYKYEEVPESVEEISLKHRTGQISPIDEPTTAVPCKVL